MSILLWKRWCEIKKTPVKLIFAGLLPLILIVLYSYIFKIDYRIQILTIPTVASTFSTYIFYTIDDISYAMFYSALGIDMKKLWYTNFITISIFEFAMSAITFIVWGNIVELQVERQTYVTAFLMIFVAMTFIALSTIHFFDNGKRTMIVASIFAVINFLLVFVPIILVVINNYEKICLILSLVSVIILGGCLVFMNNMRTETLVVNTQGYINGYDRKFFDED